MKITILFAIILVALVGSSSAEAITIDTIPVGDLGNPNDPSTGNTYGGVSYPYNIGKYEVTVGQYTAFLNAVAATDTYQIYDTRMQSGLPVAGIARNGMPGSYSYSVIGSPNHPVVYVSWADAARFANWLNNEQPTGAQNTNTTEDGAYTLNGAFLNTDLLSVTRNAGAKWFIPTENEWYKAAYYQPSGQGGDTDNYWNFPMKTNGLPFSDQPPGATLDNTRVANFYQDDAVANGYNDGYATTGSTSFNFGQNYLTDVGAYTSSTSFYGTFDQGGNVFEWNEAQVSGRFRGVRGGSWSRTDASFLAATFRNDSFGSPSNAYDDVGFRVAAFVPEPSSLMLAGIGIVGLCVRRARVTASPRT